MIDKERLKRKKYVITSGQRMEMKSLANLTGIPDQIVTDAYVQSYMTGVRPYDILQPYVAMMEAERDGRNYTRIYWHRTDDGVLHITMWDMSTGAERELLDAQTLFSRSGGFLNRAPKP